jgi:predicted nucleic acid-binding protein
MTTALDTDVIVALWDPDPVFSCAAQQALDAALEFGALIAAAPVCAELIAYRGRSEESVEAFFRDTAIVRDWNLSAAVWRAAGRAFRAYSGRRRNHFGGAPRRILADFLIGAHASENGYRLLTLDKRLYPAAFPKLKIISF